MPFRNQIFDEIMNSLSKNDFGSNDINYFKYLGKGNWNKKYLPKEKARFLILGKMSAGHFSPRQK